MCAREIPITAMALNPSKVSEDAVLEALKPWLAGAPEPSTGEPSLRDAASVLIHAYQVLPTAALLSARRAKCIALQFPDSLLTDSFLVCAALEEVMRFSASADKSDAPLVFILGDTSYGECCADEVAAQHLDADIIVHYGNACLSPSRSLPVLYIFPPATVGENPAKFATAFAAINSESLKRKMTAVIQMCPSAERVVVLYDIELHEALSTCDVSGIDGRPCEIARPRVDISRVVEASGDGASAETANTSEYERQCNSTGNASGSSGVAYCKARSASMLPVPSSTSPSATPAATVPPTAACRQRESVIGPLVFADSQRTYAVASEDEGKEDTTSVENAAEQKTAFLWISSRTLDEDHVQLRNAALRYTAMSCAGFYAWNSATGSNTEDSGGGVQPVDMTRLLGKRFRVMELTKEAERIGIVAGTLGVSGNLAIIERCKRMIERAGKRWYMLMVGKPSATKLGNFAEMDVFVLVACAQNALVDSKEHLRPVITPLELEVAMGERDWFASPYSADFADVLGRANGSNDDVASIDRDDEGGDGGSRVVARRGEWSVAVNGSDGAAEFLKRREWQGLDPGRDGDGSALDSLATTIGTGRSGVASGYSGEG
jgi:diphthamide biosynthesis protein 2